MVRSVLFHGVDLADDKIGQSISGGRGSGGLEGEDAKVVQVADEHVLVQRQLAAEIERVFAFGHADQIAERIEVGGGDRAGKRPTVIEISRDVYVG